MLKIYKCIVILCLLNCILMNSNTFAKVYQTNLSDINLIVILAIFLFFLGVFGSTFNRIYRTLINRKKSDIKGGIFFEEKKLEKRKDYKFIRTHHVLTENDYSLSKIQAIDEFFNEDKFLIFVKNIFLKHQIAWSKFDLETLKKFETTNLFEKHNEILNEFKQNKELNVIENISVHSANIYTFKQDDVKEYIEVLLNASMIDYFVNSDTFELISGDKEYKINKTYIMQFERKKGVKTQKDLEKRKKSIKILKGTPCPNCGAPLDPKLYGFCEYCMGVNKKEESWILNKIEIYED